MKKALTLSTTALLVLTACAAKINDKESPPTSSQYEVQFPSTAAAVAAESVQVFVFDAAQPGTDCQTLVQKRKSKQDLPARLVESEPIQPCEMHAASQDPALDGGKTVLPRVSYGQRSILAVALYDRGKDFQIGCGQGTVADGSAALRVTMTNANASVAVPATTCQSLTQKCKQQPACQ